MRRTRRILFTLCGALVALVLVASAAGAASVSRNDPAGDGVGPGDVRALRIAQSGSNFSVRVRTEKPLNLDTAPAWQNETTRSILRVYLDTRDATSGPDYVVVVDNDEGFLEARLVAITAFRPRGGCLPVITQPQLTQIQVSFDVACISTESDGVRGYAAYRLDQRGDGTLDSIDRAPNAGYTPTLTYET